MKGLKFKVQGSKFKGAEHFTPPHTGEGWDGVSSSRFPLRPPLRWSRRGLPSNKFTLLHTLQHHVNKL